MFPILCGILTLALTGYFAEVPFLPIEISKMGNHGAAYWCFSVGTTVTALLLPHTTPLRVAACMCLSGLGIVSDHAHPFLHIVLAFSFFSCSIASAVQEGRLPYGALVFYPLRLALTPFQFFELFASAQRWQQLRALCQWLTVASLLADQSAHITSSK